MKIEKLRRVHFVGINGIGTSGVARILLSAGKKVSGSDAEEGPLLKELQALGARTFVGHRPDNLPEGTEAVVVSSAVPEDNCEILAARQRKIPVVTYSEALGSLMEQRFGIAVAGTHGKTTTSALIAWVLRQAGEEPSFVIGGEVPLLGGNSGTGKSKYLVAEACEYRRNFLSLRPKVAVVTNIEEDHLDYYRDLTEIKSAFLEFLELLPDAGFAVLCRESHSLTEVAKRLDKTFFTYGLKNADYQPREIKFEQDGSRFKVFFGGESLASIFLRMPGRHNVLNGTAAFAVCHLLGLEPKTIAAGLGSFTGVRRRLEFKGEYRGAVVLDDYGHHPSEITATLSAVRQLYPKGKIFAVFQPHQYSRTRFFLGDFARSFALADEVIVPEIFFVRDSEESRRSVSSKDLVRELAAAGKSAHFLPSFKDVVSYLKESVGDGDIILTIGAGPVYQVADSFLRG
ncbi:MAG: UDP-N-acetylmuramate--L-alanine ligase [Candidatus Ratteibacteria bacterium]|jgi:UDP-N-acetylmuramate--alanine ligase